MNKVKKFKEDQLIIEHNELVKQRVENLRIMKEGIVEIIDIQKQIDERLSKIEKEIAK